MNFTRPMLAASLLLPSVEHTDENILAAMQKLRYPVLATLKKDGIRALRLNGSLLSRTLKPIPNRSIRKRSLVLPGGFDCELWNPELSYSQIESIVMSREHKDSGLIQFHVLDWFGAADSYQERLCKINDWSKNEVGVGFVFCPSEMHRLDTKELFNTFIAIENNGGEGVCFRTPNSPYKQGRSTLKEQYLVKLARYVREEAMIIGFVEQQLNCNPDNRNAVGLMDRSLCQHMMQGKNTLGAFRVRYGVDEFTVGTGVGLTDKLRAHIWNNQSKYLGQTITFKHKPVGKKDLPRSPIFVGFRNPIDI